VALTSRPVINRDIRPMLSATLLPELALLKVSRTISALLPVRCRSLTISAPKLRCGLNAWTNA